MGFKNKSRIVFLFFLVFSLFLSFSVSAELQTRADGEIGINIYKPTQINYTQKNVNSSEYWDDLDTPDDIDYSTRNVNSSEYWDNLDTPSDITGLDSSNIDDIFLFNDGDTATGDYTFDTDTLHIDSTNDRVGVGTNSPETPLNIKTGGVASEPSPLLVNSDSSDGGIAFHYVASSSAEYSGFGFGMYWDGSEWVSLSEDNARILKHGGANLLEFTGDMGETVGGESSATRRMVIDLNNGNVGINTDSPSSKLDVDGNTEITGALATGSNTLSGLNDGDINVSNIYYDTLTAKSPIFKGTAHSNWKEVEFTEHISEDWKLGIKVNDVWDIEEVYFKYPEMNIDRFYTPTEFNNQVCDYNSVTRDMCDQIINKTNRLHDKKVCVNDGYNWDGSCYEINKIEKTYSEVVEQKPVYNTTTTETNYTCTKLNETDLTTYETTCTNTTTEETDEIIDYSYNFKNKCDWNEDIGYYCKERSEIIV